MAIWPHPCPCGGGCWDIKPIVRLDPNEEQAQEPQRLRQPIFRGRVQSLQLGRRERHHEPISGSERHEYFIVSVSTLPLAHLLVHPSPKGQQQEISGPGRESERRDRGYGEQKSREPGSFVSAKKSPAVDLWLTNRLRLQQTVCSPFRSAARPPSCRQRQHVLAALKHSSSTDAMLINVTPASQISRGELRNRKKGG